VQAGWKAIGINTKLTNLTWAVYLSDIESGKAGDQIFRLAWIADYPSIDDFTWGLFGTPNSGATLSTFYSNPKVDQLCQQARGTIDETQRMNLYVEAMKLILNDAPAIPLYSYRDYRLTNNRVKNFVLDPLYEVNMWTLWIPGSGSASATP
jgi:peptide/nickel transport system substrate-binding protein